MKKIIIGENIEKKLVALMLKENINGDSDLEFEVEKYLSSKYKPNYQRSGDGMSTKRIYHLIDTVSGMPISDKYVVGDLVISDLEKNFPKCKLNREERRKFLVNVLDKWYRKNFMLGSGN